jgi:hypothetical protein
MPSPRGLRDIPLRLTEELTNQGGSLAVRKSSLVGSYKLGAPGQREREAQMHALVTRVTIHDADRTRDMLNSQVVPGVSGAPGFQAGYWTWSDGGGERNGLAMMIFDSAENARERRATE